MKKLYFVVLILLVSKFVYSQNIELIVVDSTENNPIQDVAISIYSTALEVKDKLLRTDAQGKVNFSLIKPGILDSIVVELDLYDKKVLRFINVVKDTTINVQIKNRSVQLEEVQVGVNGGTRFSNNKIVYYPRSSEFNKTRTVTDLIPMIPNMSSRNGNHFFRNDGNFIILIDGLGENRSKEEQLKILENMPIDAIYRIEMVDNPSARYGDGVVAVINFLTKQDVAYSSLRGGATKQMLHDGSQTDSPNSFNMSGDSRFRLNDNNLHFFVRLANNRSLQENSYEQAFLNNLIEQRNYMNGSSKNSYYSFIMDRKLGQNFSAQINTYYSFNDSRNKGESNVYSLENGNTWSRITTNNLELLKQRRFVFTPQFKYVLNKEKGTALYMNPTYAFISLFEDNTYEDSGEGIATSSNSSTLGSETEIYFVDLILDNILKNNTLQTSVGYKYNFLKNNQTEGGSFDYQEHQNTFFLTNSIKIKKATLNADVRTEHLYYNANNVDTSATYRTFFFYPKANISYPLSDQTNILIGYERQILRLSSIALNSQIRYNGYLSGTRGNIELQPRVTDYYYSRLYLEGHTISLSFKKHRNHRIFVPMNEEEPFIEEQTTYNYFRQFYITYDKDFEVNDFWTVNLGVYGYMNRMESADFDFVNTKDNNIMVDLSNELTLGKNRISFDFSYMSPNYSVYGEDKPVVYNSFNYNRLFFKNTLDLSLIINDFLGVTRENYLMYHPYITGSFDNITNQRSVLLQFSYRFPAGRKSRNNNYKTDRKDEIRM